MPVYDFSKPEDLARYLLTLPTKGHQRASYTFYRKRETPEFMEKLDKEIYRQREANK